jgi:hypothetical protein
MSKNISLIFIVLSIAFISGVTANLHLNVKYRNFLNGHEKFTSEVAK